MVLDLHVQYLPRWVRDRNEPNLHRAPLELVRCTGCGLLQLGSTVEPDLLYREFWYRSGINETMKRALYEVVEASIRAWGGLHPDKPGAGAWLDIGANDGYLLTRVPDGFEKTACEPALNFTAQLEELAQHTVADYFSAKSCPGPYDVITSAAMFYDLDDPNSFVADIASVLKDDGIWVNQLNDSPTMLKANAFDAICHEHLCYYDVPSLNQLYRRHGLTIKSITYNDVNGGSIRVIASKKGQSGADVRGIPGVTAADAHEFARRIQRWKAWMLRLQFKSLWGYGASTKGSTLLQFLGASASVITAIADRNPLKVGTMMAGTWIPVRDEVALRATRPEAVLVLPWAFRSEFLERETELRANGTAMVFPLPNIEIVP